jgi:two-component system nitrogen regulation sensor histidine kinase NtrY
MKNLRILFGLLFFSIAAIIITGIALNYLGIRHGHLLVKIGLVFILVNILLALMILIFSVIRNLVDFYFEKKKKTIGSKFRTQLVVSFVGLTLVPSVLLFVLSFQLINNSIDTWFSLEVQKPIYDSMDLANIYYSEERAKAERYAALLASDALHRDNPFYGSLMNNYSSVRYTNPDSSSSDLIKNAFNGTTDSDVLSQESGDIIMAVSPIRENGVITGVIVVERVIPRSVVLKLESIRNAFNQYNQIRVQQNPIRFLYFLMLTVATLVIIFLALWISLRIAKSITVPIRSLAEATRTVTQGDLDFRIDIQRDDEIGLLINSFNKMLDDVQEGKMSLEKTFKEADRRRLGMEAILESINSGVIFFDRTGKIATINSSACAMLDLDRLDITGKGHKVIVDRLKSEDLSQMVKYLGKRGYGSIEREIHIYVHGRPMDLRVFITTLNDSRGNFIGTLVVFDNLTEIIMAQRALAWQEVAKRIAHEIKNPLTPIKLSAERLAKAWNEQADNFDDILARSAKTIVKEVNNLRSLVDEFSKFGKLPKISLEPSDIRQIISEVVELYSDTRDIRIITSLKDTPSIEIDREQIRRALINLIDNAIQSETERIWVHSEYFPSLDLIRVEVLDEGVGISEENKEKLFFPYFSTKKEGTGLGLAIVNSIVSKHRGYIRVRDNQPKGSVFIIELPVDQKYAV